MSNKMDEMILVVPREELFAGGAYSNEFLFQGTETDETAIKFIMSNAERHVEVMRRGNAEEDIKYKQVIPYVVIRRDKEIFMYRRLSGGGESRLHDKLSIGVGGHVNEVGGKSLGETLYENMIRELHEELIIDAFKVDLTTIGLINDDDFDNPKHVGNVHLGILVIADISSESNIQVRETDQLKGEWTTLEELQRPEIFDRLESWSQIAVKALV